MKKTLEEQHEEAREKERQILKQQIANLSALLGERPIYPLEVEVCRVRVNYLAGRVKAKEAVR